SRATLTEYGNIASGVVLDALRRLFDEGLPQGARGLLAGFGPGITAEASLGTWTTDSPSPTPSSRQSSTRRHTTPLRRPQQSLSRAFATSYQGDEESQ
ncbi:hypothetical protein ACH4YL_40560, partial [Streptomyces sp. NPDC020681]